MAYPHIRLTRTLRIVFMLGLVAAFFVIAPIILLYTAGYRYDIQNARTRLTGAMSIDIEPEDAQVYLNDVRLDKRLPIRLTSYAPGIYHLRIERDGFIPWDRTVEVKSGQTTYIKDITLFAESTPSTVKTLLEQTQSTISPTGAGLVGVRSETAAPFFFTTQTNTSVDIPLVVDSAPTVSFSPTGDTLVMRDDTRLTLVDTANPTTPNSYTFTEAGIHQMQWDADAQPVLFVQDGTWIIQIHTDESGIFGTLPDVDIVWYIDADGHMWSTDTDKRNIHNADNQSFTSPETIQKIIHINSDRAIVQTDSGFRILFQGDAPNAQLRDAVAARYNRATNEWIVWSNWDLWAVYDNGEHVLQTRFGERILDVHPLDEFGVLLLHTENGLKGFNPGYYTTHTLLQSQNIVGVGVDIKNRDILYLDSDTLLKQLRY